MTLDSLEARQRDRQTRGTRTRTMPGKPDRKEGRCPDKGPGQRPVPGPRRGTAGIRAARSKGLGYKEKRTYTETRTQTSKEPNKQAHKQLFKQARRCRV